MKKLYNTAFIYALLALAAGLVYRELPKFFAYQGATRLSLLHVHFFVLGMVFFLLALILEKLFGISRGKGYKAFFLTYNLGLALTTGILAVRGVLDVLEAELAPSLDASLAGLAGIGHILLTVGIVLFFLLLGRSLGSKKEG